MSAPQPIPQASVERYGDGVLVHWPDGTTAQYIETGNCVTAAPQPQPVGEWAMVERAAIVGICRILERDGDEHGAAAELRQLLRAAPQPQAEPVAALRELREVVIAQNNLGASWHPEIFGRLMAALQRSQQALADAPQPQPQPQASAEPTISEVLAEYERQTKELPCQHEVPERGCCSYNWRTAIIGELRAIADEAKRIRASLGVVK